MTRTACTARTVAPRLFTALALVAAVAALVSMVGCDEEKTYPVTFTCRSSECSQGQAQGQAQTQPQSCSALPLDAGGCEELPGLFGNPPTPVESGRPAGCEVGLSYGNPFYGHEQQTCICNRAGFGDAGKLGWTCGI